MQLLHTGRCNFFFHEKVEVILGSPETHHAHIYVCEFREDGFRQSSAVSELVTNKRNKRMTRFDVKFSDTFKILDETLIF